MKIYACKARDFVTLRNQVDSLRIESSRIVEQNNDLLKLIISKRWVQ